MKTLLILLLGSFLYTSCAPAPSTTNAKISLGAATGSANFPGGLIIIAQNPDTGREIIKPVPISDEIIFELPTNTKWRFMAIGWDGSNQFEGNNYCAQTSAIEMLGTEFDIPLNASRGGCGNTLQPLGSDGNFPKIAVANCYGVKDYIDIGYNIPAAVQCGDPLLQGDMKAFKIRLLGIDENNTVLKGPASKCYNVSQGITGTDVSLPHGVGIANLQYHVEFYNDSSCSQGVVDTFYFETGIQEKELASGNRGIALMPSTDMTTLLLSETACRAEQMDNQPFAAGSSSFGMYLICNKDQWQNIAKGSSCPVESGGVETVMDCEADATYLLGTDIDMTGSTTITDTFSGSLKGGFKTLKNVSAPLFESISASTNEIRISEFIIVNSHLTVDGSTGPKGMLANKISSAGSGNQIEIDRIKVLNSSITDTVSSSNALGGFIGELDWSTNQPTSNDSIFLRKILSQVDLTYTGTTAKPMGGLIGVVETDSTNYPNITTEFVGVGIVDSSPESYEIDKFEFKDKSARITINSGTADGVFVGGMIGQVVGAFDHRLKSVAISKIIAQGASSIVGGLVGRASNNGAIYGNLNINNSAADLIFEPSGDTQALGGLVGRTEVGSNLLTLNIDGSFSQLSVGSSDVDLAPQVSYLGGILGSYYSTATTQLNLLINNSQAISNVFADSTYVGGIVGFISNASMNSYSSVSNISNCTSRGYLMDGDSLVQNSDNTMNLYKGGLVGYAGKYLSLSRNFTEMGIEGYQYIGGAFGYGEYVKLEEFDFTGSLIAVDDYIGGIAGKSYLDGSHSNIKLQVQILHSAANSNRGLLYGYIDSSLTPHTNGVILEGSTLSSLDPSSDIYCGTSNSYCTGSYISNNYEDPTAQECLTLSGVAPFTTSNNSAVGACELSFIDTMLRFAPYVENSQIQYRTGSVLDPYVIKTVADWNYIEDDAYLMSKSFEVRAPLDFSNRTFNPIGKTNLGAAGEPFSGVIFGDYAISNINFNTSNYWSGVVSNSKHGQLGLRDRPLVFENLTLNCTGSISCGLIGTSESSKVFAQVYNANYTATSGSVGGLIGTLFGDSELDGCSFSGSINGNATNAGGFFGELGGGSQGQFRMEECFVNLSSLSAGTYAGGMVGYGVDTGGNSTIKNSYVWIDPFDLHAGDDISGSTTGGLFGYYGTDVSVESSYVDYSSAQLPTGFRSAGHYSSGTVSLSGLTVVGSASDDAAAVPNASVADMSSLEYYDDKWVLTENGRYVLDWQVNGFEN